MLRRILVMNISIETKASRICLARLQCHGIFATIAAPTVTTCFNFQLNLSSFKPPPAVSTCLDFQLKLSGFMERVWKEYQGKRREKRVQRRGNFGKTVTEGFSVK